MGDDFDVIADPDQTTALEHDVTELPDRIRDYCRERQDLWRQVPYLALQADGRTGHSGQYARAYRRGVWTVGDMVEIDCETGEPVSSGTVGIEPTPENSYEAAAVKNIHEDGGVYDGNLLEDMEAQYGTAGTEAVRSLMQRRDVTFDVDWNATISYSDPEPASDDALLRLVPQLDALDAARIVDRLEDRGAEEHGSYYDPQEKRQWRRNLEEWTGVEPEYRRKTLDEQIDDWKLP